MQQLDNGSSGIQPDLALCVCTYNRPQLLALLLQDIVGQSVCPGMVIVVDGDPSSGGVLDVLRTIRFPEGVSIRYIPSNHSNLAYQRYVGWLSVRHEALKYFLYLDDDLRLTKLNAISKVVEPLTWKDERIVGVTAQTVEGNPAKMAAAPVLVDRRKGTKKGDPWLVWLLGAARDIPPGGLSPSGHRKVPTFAGNSFSEVEWLSGRIMAYDFSIMNNLSFSEDLFSLYALKLGKGEDTFLSTRFIGKKIFIFEAGYLHPDDELPNAYPVDAYRFGYAIAYSRRFLNDHYRPFGTPTWSDRFALFKSYVGTSLLIWWNALVSLKGYRFTYACGYSLGALRGLLQKPTAKNLTPHIDWWSDAEQAIAKQVILQ